MSDPIDIANEHVERERQMLLARRAALAEAGPEAKGTCLYCDEPLDDARRWCNADCRDGWQDAQDARRRYGR